MKQSETKNEEWRPVPNYEGLYEVSNMGNVRSLPRLGTHTTKPTLISPHLRCGYYHVTLWKNNRQKDCTVHRLVALAFIPNPDNLPVLNHKDEDKTNNKSENLEWCTRKYNNNYSNIQKSVVASLGQPVEVWDVNGLHLGWYESIRAAARAFGISLSPIHANLKRGKPNRMGLTFNYTEK